MERNILVVGFAAGEIPVFPQLNVVKGVSGFWFFVRFQAEEPKTNAENLVERNALSQKIKPFF